MNKLVETIEALGDTPSPRFGHTITSIGKDKFVLFGGAIGDTVKYSMVNETYVYNCLNNKWTKLNLHGVNPSPRAAHSATSVELMQIVLYGGATGGGGFASDDLYLLDMKNGDEIAQWMIVQVSGPTPGKRYGHTAVFIKPFIIIFGGNSMQNIMNDVWSLNVEKNPFSWTKLDCGKINPPPRVYHSSSICQIGSAGGMMVIFGGRGSDQSSLNDTWGLRRHRDGSWDWVKAPYREGSLSPTGRYQSSILFCGTNMIIVGGRTNILTDLLGLDAYDTETSECISMPMIKRFRHASFVNENYIFVFGGFDHDSSNVPSNNLLKIDINKIFKSNESQPKIENKENDLRQSKNSKLIFPANNIDYNSPTDKILRLSSNAYVALSYALDSQNEKTKFDRIIPINQLAEESKKLVVKSKMIISPGDKGATLENVADFFISELMRTKELNRNRDQFIRSSRKNIMILLKDFLSVVQNFPNVINIKAPAKIYGGLYGQFSDLLRHFDLWRMPSQLKNGDIDTMDYLFLGDYVDRGSHSIEIILLLFALKIKFPNNIHLLRGHHEDIQVNKYEGLGLECSKRFNEDINDNNSIFIAINTIFSFLPLAAIIEGQFFCTHAGIGYINKVEEIQKIPRPIEIVMEPTNVEQQIVLDLLWSDPSENESQVGISPNYSRNANQKNSIVKFGMDRVAQFLKANNFSVLIRSHECVQNGFERIFNGLIISLISSTCYCGKYDNSGAILVIQKNLEFIPKIMMAPAKNVSECWINESEFTRQIQITPQRRNK